MIVLQYLGLNVPPANAATPYLRVINYWSVVVFGFLIIYIVNGDGRRLSEERLGVFDS